MADDEMVFSGETLESLLEASKTPEGRWHLASAGTLDAILRLPSFPPHTLLHYLRLLRNLCAGEAANQDSFIESGGPDRIAAILLGPRPAPPEVLRAGLQLLGNVALAGEAHRSAVWARFFPSGFLELARVREPGVCDPLCMVLDTCCSSDGGRWRLEELCGFEKGLPILLEIITTASTAGHHEEWLEWLLSKVCIEDPYFFLLFSKLGPSNVSHNSSGVEYQYTVFTNEQAFLLGVLSKCLTERPEDITISNDFALDILKILKAASTIVDFNSRGSSALPTGSPAIDVLGYSLAILRDICAWENPTSPATETLIDSLLSAGFLELLLSYLHQLEPPSTVRKSIIHVKDQIIQQPITDSSKVCPYKGYRRDVVSVIGNCLHRRKQVQDETRLLNGIPLLLQQCVVDEDNPFLREWGLLAVRNLLEGNEENQCAVAQLELQEPVTSPEIAGLGLKVEVDKESGRAKLVNIS
ncbi:ataxin-10 [Phoenix dactylifera]|uniref:Ataxin-10 n=1 Tax=Phoenix dactylifera TaxID=42345 RepID=A0A8B9A7E4_PHODC|nr:ataxin-10 [Phoenix dactylifera]XP_026656760.2 ataxin-10 [Phoenix dactylifera]XP_026656761.2 ataxin-10 [Phoenix dactylifera]XP_038982580.1 ataxin-10 [Phoenix dactylifera]